MYAGVRVWDKNAEQMYYDEFVIVTDGELNRIVFYSEIDEELHYNVEK